LNLNVRLALSFPLPEFTLAMFIYSNLIQIAGAGVLIHYSLYKSFKKVISLPTYALIQKYL